MKETITSIIEIKYSDYFFEINDSQTYFYIWKEHVEPLAISTCRWSSGWYSIFWVDICRILDFVGRCIFNRYCSTVRLKSSTIIYLRCSLVSHFKTFRNSGELKRLTCIKVFVACNNCNCNCIFENVVNGDWSNR